MRVWGEEFCKDIIIPDYKTSIMIGNLPVFDSEEAAKDPLADSYATCYEDNDIAYP